MISFTEIIELISILILIILSGFFSKAETAFTGLSRVRLRSMADAGDLKAAKVIVILDRYSEMLSSILIGNNIVNLSASALATTVTIQLFGSMMVGISTGILTLLILIFGEIIPKRQAAAEPEKYALRYAGFISVYLTVLKPLVLVIEVIARGIAFIFHLNVDNAEALITEDELKTYVDVSHEDGAIESDEMELIHNVFDFGDAAAKDIMIPRVDMEAIDVNAGYSELLAMFRNSMFTRIPVYESPDEHDNMIGFVNIKDLLLVEDTAGFSISGIMRKAYYTTETKKLADLMSEMREKLNSVAFVINEYGETVGMITMEDLVEELVGEIRDEYDYDESELIKKVGDGRFIVDASVKLVDLKDELGIDLDSENYESVGGIILEKLERIPETGDEVSLDDGMKLKVQEMDDQRILKVLLTLPHKEEH